jgi:DMSO/TMAO reductase YedYZ heme-binding membrane subunit
VKKDTLFPFIYLAVFAVLLGYRVVRALADGRRRSTMAVPR